MRLRKRLGFDAVRKDAARRQVFGWAYSSVLNGQPVIDHDRDTIPPAELERAAYDYVRLHRQGSLNHDRLGVAECIESVFIDKSKAEGLGIESPSDDVRWWVGFQITDAETWAAVEAGELREFSIEGEAVKSPHPEVQGANVLKELNIEAIALVAQGAGRGVPVRLRKGRQMNVILKAAKTAAKLDEEQAAVVKGLVAGRVAKADLRPTLEAAGLDETQIAIVMGLLEAAMSPPGESAPAAEVIEEKMEEEEKAEPSAEEKAEDEEMAKEEDKDEAEVSKALKSEVAKLRSEVAKERHMRRLEKARATAERDYAGVPMLTPHQVADVMLMVEDGVLGSVGAPLLKSLKAVHEMVAKGEGMFAAVGANGHGPVRSSGDAWDEIQPLVQKHRKAGLSHSQAISKALQEHAATSR